MRKLLLAASCAVLSACAGSPPRVEAPFRPAGRLGIRTMETVGPDLRRDLGIPQDLPGELVLAVFSGSPAQDCGVEPGEFLSHIDGAPFVKTDQIGAKGAGAKVAFEAHRGGSARTLSCTLGGYPAALGLRASVVSGRGLKLETPPAGSALESAMKGLKWPSREVHLDVIDGRRIMGFEDVKAALAERKPGETVQLGLRSYWSKRKPQVPLTLRDGDSPDAPPVVKPAARAAKTLVVAQDGSGEFRTLLGALVRSEPGDTILLRAGRYELGVPMLYPERTLRGEGEKTVLSPGLLVTGVRGTVLEDLSIEYAGEGGTAQSAAASAKAELVRAVRGAIGGRPSASQLSYSDAAILMLDRADGTVLRRVTVSGPARAVVSQFSRDVLIEDCRVRGAKIGLLVWGGDAKVQRLLAYENQDGVVVAGEGVASLRALTVADNRERGVAVETGRAELYDSILAGSPTLLIRHDGARFSGGYNDYFEGNICSGGGGRGGLSCAAASEAGKDADLKKESDLSLDPLFAERLKGDYRLSLESPLIGRGRGGGHIGALAPVGSGAGGEGFR